MNNEEPYRDQAERLKRRIEKINENTEESDRLPPREQVHRQKKNKFKWKIKYPVIRLLVLFFILLPIIIFSVISYLDGNKTNETVKTSGNSVGYETINLEKSKPTVDDKTDKADELKQTEQNKDSANNPTGNSGEATTPAIVQPENNSASTDPGNSPTEQAPATVPAAVPAQTTNNQTEAAASQPAKTEEKIIYHTVQPQETLYRIAMKYYHSKAGVGDYPKSKSPKGS